MGSTERREAATGASCALRPYQTAILRQQTEQARQHRRLLVVLATGLGKTEIALSNIASAVSRGYRVIYLAHREELLTQPADRLRARGIDHAIIKGRAHGLRLSKPIHVASVDTLAGWPEALEALSAPRMLVYVDEAHLICAERYRRVVAAWPQAFLVGQTATPYRLDGSALGEFFDVIVEGIRPAEALAQGYLVEPTIYAEKQADLRGVKKAQGDYAKGQLAERMSAITGDIVATWKKHAAGLATICFAVNVKHSKAIVEAFMAAGVEAAHVDADTSTRERRRTLERLACGDVQIVSNVDILTTGFDGASYAVPDRPYVPLSCLIAARPTQSMSLWFQMVGRGTRPGKPRLIVLDHAGNTWRHGHLRHHHSFTLDGMMNGEKVKGFIPPGVRRCSLCMALWPTSKEICDCGGALTEPRPVRQKAGDLSLLDPQGEKVRKPTPAEKATAYRDLVVKGQAKGYKLGWARIQFRAIYKHWPQPEAERRVLDELGIRARPGTAPRAAGAGRFF